MSRTWESGYRDPSGKWRVVSLAPVTGGPLAGPGPLADPEIIAPLRRAYRDELEALAERLMPDIEAGKYRSDDEDEQTERVVAFENLCAREPLCRHWLSARVVLVASRFSDSAWRAQLAGGMGPPNEGDAWAELAGHCVARDLAALAERRGCANAPELRSALRSAYTLSGASA